MRNRRTFAMGLGVAWLALTAAAPRATAQWDGYYLFLGNWPDPLVTGLFSPAPQGLAHDAGNWFITQETELYKIPVEQDLAHPLSGLHASIGSYTQLAGYDHFGDLECYQGYLVVPVEGKSPPLLAFLNAGDLRWVGSCPVAAEEGTHAAWVAIDSGGYLYASGPNSSWISAYWVDWPALVNDRRLVVNFLSNIRLRDADGNPTTQTDWGQGGAFSEDGRLFYLVVGRMAENIENDGISVFDTTTWRRVQRSSAEAMPFLYEFHPGILDLEEPEGLTVWNLDGAGAPGVSGQLHVLLWNQDTWSMYIKHYTHTICVNASYSGVSYYGQPDKPFRTVTEANDLAWDGSRVNIAAGTYPEMLTFSRRMEVSATGGLVQIGSSP